MIEEAASRVAASLESWTNPTPPRFIASVPDLWGGDAEAGRHIVTGCFVLGDQNWSAPRGDVWSAGAQVPDIWRKHVLSFDFLPHLRACGSDAARREARYHIEKFIERCGHRSDLCGSAGLAARRLIHWLVHYDFYGTSATYEFQLTARRALAQHARVLMKHEAARGLPLITQSVALSLAGLVMEDHGGAYVLGQMWLESALKDYVRDAGVATRRPSDAVETLAMLLTLRCTMLQSGIKPPEFMRRAVDELAGGIRFLRGGDKKLPLFQGGMSGNVAALDQLLRRADSRAKAPGTTAMGYHKMAAGRSVLIFDCGAPPALEHDDDGHAAPLAFEYWVGKDRLFTQCGDTAFLPPVARDALRGTAAHTALIIDDRNIAEIRSNSGGMGRRYSAPYAQRWEIDGGVMVEALHTGYQSVYGLTHRRKLALLEDGECLAGEDEVRAETDLLRGHIVTLRFHLHPRVQASLIQNDTEVLLRLPSGGGWRFAADGGPISLEESLYCGSGRARTTQCITLTRVMETQAASIPWVVQAELPS